MKHLKETSTPMWLPLWRAGKEIKHTAVDMWLSRPTRVCMSLTYLSSMQVKTFPKLDLDLIPSEALCLCWTAIIINHKEKSHFSLKPSSSSTISQNPSLKDTNLKHHHHQPSLKTTIFVNLCHLIPTLFMEWRKWKLEDLYLCEKVFSLFSLSLFIALQ